MFEESGSVYGVESIGEVCFQKNGGGVMRISFTPLSCRLKANLSPERFQPGETSTKDKNCFCMFKKWFLCRVTILRTCKTVRVSIFFCLVAKR